MKFIETRDAASGETIKLAYEDYGEGKPIVLIHGWPLRKEMWEYQLDALVDAGLRVITYDRRGFGESDKPWNGYDYDTLAADLKAILENLNLQDVTLVGFSMGGGEVVRYFKRYGNERISKVILVSSVVPYMLQTDDNVDGVPQEQMNEWIEQLKKDRLSFLDTFGKNFFGIGLLNHPVSAPLLEYYRMLASLASPRATKECIKAFGFTDFREDAGLVNVPTLIIHGDNDKIVPIEMSSKKTYQLIANSQYVVYENAPHGLWYTHKERLCMDIVSFITNGTIASYSTEIESGYVVLPSNEEALVTR